MILKTRLKLGEITNLSDARFAAGCGADFIGFNLSPDDENYLSPEKVQEIAAWVDGPKLVGEWNSGIDEIILDTAARLQLDYIQLNSLDINLGTQLKDYNVVQNIEIEQDTTVAQIIQKVEAAQHFTHFFMLSMADAAVQENFLQNSSRIEALRQLCTSYPVMLNFHFSERNILTILEEIKPFGINLKGSSEIKPGYKDFDLLNNLVEKLEI